MSALRSDGEEQAATFEAGRRKTAELRVAGRDPSQTREVRKKGGAKNGQRITDQKTWEAELGIGADRKVFTRVILSRLQGVSLGALVKATGLSQQ